MQKFSGEGRHPLPRPNPLGAYGASIFAPAALKLNVTPPPRKKSYTALVVTKQEFLVISHTDFFDAASGRHNVFSKVSGLISVSEKSREHII